MLDACVCTRCILMWTSTISRTTHGERGLTYQKKWRIHIWESLVMGDMFMWFLGSMVPNAVLLRLGHLHWTL